MPQLGITVPAAAMRRFWIMLAHSHGRTWNASSLGRALSKGADVMVVSRRGRTVVDMANGPVQRVHENSDARSEFSR